MQPSCNFAEKPCLFCFLSIADCFSAIWQKGLRHLPEEFMPTAKHVYANWQKTRISCNQSVSPKHNVRLFFDIREKIISFAR